MRKIFLLILTLSALALGEGQSIKGDLKVSGKGTFGNNSDSDGTSGPLCVGNSTTCIYKSNSVGGDTIGFTANGLNLGGTAWGTYPTHLHWVLGNNDLLTTLSVSGPQIALNSSDFSTPQANAITAGNNFQDSLCITADTQPDCSFGSGIQFFARDHATDLKKTKFWNDGFLSGWISSNNTWTIGEASGLRAHQVNGTLTMRADQNARSILKIDNESTGSGAAAQLKMTTNAGDFNILANTVAGGAIADITTDSTFTAGLRISALGNTPITLRTNSTDAITIAGSNQAVTIGPTSGSASNIVNGFLTVQGTGTSQFSIKDTVAHSSTGAPTMTFRDASNTLGQLGFPTANTYALTLNSVNASGSIDFQINSSSKGGVTSAGLLSWGTGGITTTGQLVGKGTSTNDSASAGYIGEYQAGTVTSDTDFGTTAQYFDTCSKSLTAGDWDVTLMVYVNPNGGTLTTPTEIGISTTSGNSATGLDKTNTARINTPASTSTTVSQSVPNVRVSLSGTTTVYGKMFASYTGSPKYQCRLSARRMR